MSIAILRFHAGDTAYAIAAGNVDAIGPARPGLPHLARVLGDTTAVSPESTRVLRLRAGDRAVDVVVDGPVELVQLAVANITPCQLGAIASATFLGFARDADRVFVLLDVPSLVDKISST
jgi:chemotaxis signal transduction protein